MKKILILLFVLTFQLSEAAWLTSFEEAQKEALATNKFMIVDFWATWCGPCKKMDSDSWSDQNVNLVLLNYVKVKINIDFERELANKYGINSIPNMFIMDANGKVVYSFSGYHDANGLKRELDKFALSTQFLSSDLATYYKLKGYNSSVRISQKYFDYSLLVNKDIQWDIINTADDYLADAKKMLSKTDEGYAEKKQRLELLSLYKIAYTSNFSKLEKKINEFKENEISENNTDQYYFLKYLVYKGTKKEGSTVLEEKVKTIEGFDYFIQKINLIIAKSS